VDRDPCVLIEQWLCVSVWMFVRGTRGSGCVVVEPVTSVVIDQWLFDSESNSVRCAGAVYV
jgi:hypothetical protein